MVKNLEALISRLGIEDDDTLLDMMLRINETERADRFTARLARDLARRAKKGIAPFSTLGERTLRVR